MGFSRLPIVGSFWEDLGEEGSGANPSLQQPLAQAQPIDTPGFCLFVCFFQAVLFCHPG